jgi:hypothetical protein
MRHELFAILENPNAATSALSEICTRPELGGRYSVVVHRDGIEQASTDPVLAHEERGTHEGFYFGALLGALGGVTALAILEAPFSLMGGGPAFPALIGAGAGAAVGAFVGALTGSAYGDTHFQRLAARLRDGQVLVSVNVDGLAREHEIEEILHRHGAQTTHRAAF